MKIICIARNYSEHAAEMGAPQYERGSREAVSPAFFLKPDSALLLKNQPFFYPEFSQRIEYETELVVRIDKVGKSIEERFAHKYYRNIFNLTITISSPKATEGSCSSRPNKRGCRGRFPKASTALLCWAISYPCPISGTTYRISLSH